MMLKKTVPVLLLGLLLLFTVFYNKPEKVPEIAQVIPVYHAGPFLAVTAQIVVDKIKSIQEFNPQRVLLMEATAYSWGCGTGDGLTATGTVPTAGRTVAVDPSVIMYGTRLVIDGVGGYVAEDTGGAIRGMKIDLFVDSREEAIQHGRRSVEVSIKGGIKE